MSDSVDGRRQEKTAIVITTLLPGKSRDSHRASFLGRHVVRHTTLGPPRNHVQAVPV